jgi:hypothetical protein
MYELLRLIGLAFFGLSSSFLAHGIPLGYELYNEAPQTVVFSSAELEAEPPVALYGLFEHTVINNNSYTNPFDFNEIELRSEFRAPSGKTYSFWGFYDGDGDGNNLGNVWRLRFTPDETGIWQYTYSWTDTTPGGSGSFAVVDTGIPGPLRIAEDNPWFFEDARGRPIHARGYSLHQYLEGKYGRGIFSDEAVADLNDKIKTKVADRDYNLLMLAWPVFSNNPGHHFWQHTNPQIDFSRYHLDAWHKVEEILSSAAEEEVYVFPFLALVDQLTKRPNDEQMTLLLRYMAARLGPYWNNFGYSATWEYHDIWSHEYADSVMSRLSNNLAHLPIPPLLTIHDHSNNLFANWLDFSMRQQQSRNVFAGNIHGGGQQGGVGTAFLNKPVIGSEDIWEICSGKWEQPRNATEVRRGAWGLLMAGVIPVYLEVGLTDALAPCSGRSDFSGEGEPHIRRMFDFFYAQTQYRHYQQLNNLVSRSARQIASGIPGEEYLIYDEDGGQISLDLRNLPSSSIFSTLWFDPTTGEQKSGDSVQGGERAIFHSPFAQDTVLLLWKEVIDTTPFTIVSANLLEDVNQLEIVFSKAVEEQSATNVANYQIDHGIIILQASLDETLTRVLLTTSPHWDGSATIPGARTFTVTVNGVRDRANPPNTIAANSQVTYTVNLNWLFLPTVRQSWTVSVVVVLLVISAVWSRLRFKNR